MKVQESDQSKESLENYHISFYDFSLETKRSYCLSPIATGKEEIANYLSSWMPSNSKLQKIDWRWQEPKKEDFAKYFDDLKEAIYQGKTKKAVPICFSTSEYTLQDSERIAILSSLIENHELGHPLAFISEEFEYFGMSPELLFRKEGNSLSTMALAGTKSLDENYQDSLFLDDPKERAEHQFVVDSLESLLNSFGSCKKTPTGILRLNKIAHLKTELNVELEKTVATDDLVKQFHPTPALGDYPKGSMKTWFEKMGKDLNRGIFGAPILIEKGEQAICIVGIRCLFREDTHWKLGSGCGVVAQSELGNEWQELSMKRTSVRNFLGFS